MRKPTPISLAIALTGLLLATAASSQAAIVLNWINWTDPGSYPLSNGSPFYNYATAASGSITMPDASVRTVTLSGEVLSTVSGASAFDTSTDSFWSTENYNNTTYISANVPTLPPNSDRIGVAGYRIASQNLTFSAPVTNIVMNVWSLGNPTILGSWVFDQPFVILSDNFGEWTGSGAPYALQSAPGNTLNGYEGAGTIQFTGTFSSLSWTVSNPEFYAVWNMGVTSASAAAVPEPGQVAASLLLLAGIGGYVWMKRRKAAKPAGAVV